MLQLSQLISDFRVYTKDFGYMRPQWSHSKSGYISHEHQNSMNDLEPSVTSATWTSLPWNSSRWVTLWSTFLYVLQELIKLLHGFVNHIRSSAKPHLGTWYSGMVRSPKQNCLRKGDDAIILTLNLMIISIVGNFHRFKAITRTFLHFASDWVCIWFEQSRSFPKVWTWQHHKILFFFWWGSFCLGQSFFCDSVSLQVLRISLSLWDSDQAIVTQFETQKDWFSDDLSDSVLKWYCDICFFGHEMPCASMYYNATLAQSWPRGVHTLRKHMRQVQQWGSV